MIERKQYTQDDFSWVSWDEKYIQSLPIKIIEKKRSIYNAIKAIQDKDRDFQNTVYAIESSDYEISDLTSFLSVHLNASPVKSIREAAKDALDVIQEQLIEIEFDEDIYKAVKVVAEKRENLDPVSQKLLDDLLLSYKRSGFELPKDKRDELKENIKKLALLGTEFDKNINDYKDHILLSENELDGLSEGFVKGLNKKDDKYVVTLEYPDFFPFIQNSKLPEKRKEIIDKSSRKGGEKNLDVLSQIMGIRRANAELLGYRNHADFKLEVKMAKDTKTVRNFISDLVTKLKDKQREELSELRKLKAELEGGDDINYYDISYISNEHLKRTHNIDQEKLREYFPLEHVMNETQEIYSELLGIRFEKENSFNLWHEDVKLYKVYDKSGSFLSYIGLDLHPREGKFGHAAVFGIVSGRSENYEETNYRAPFSSMIANFPKNTEHRPSLLSHDEVETYFHEFGHLMHGVLTTARYGSQSGSSVAWDFVEAPSQMLEHWVWDKEMLRRLSSHYKSGEAIPSKMQEDLIGSKLHMMAMFIMRQLVFAKYDFDIHVNEGVDLVSYYAELVEELLGYTPSPNQIFPAGFGHLVGYDAGYYGYLWSKVYATDMFSRFKEKGLLDSVVGGEYRKWILEKGSSVEEMDLLKGFLNREPSNEPFLGEIGVK